MARLEAMNYSLDGRIKWVLMARSCRIISGISLDKAPTYEMLPVSWWLISPSNF